MMKCAGLINFLTSYAEYLPGDETHRV